VIRYRLLREQDEADLGPFVSMRGEWRQGARISRRTGEELIVVRTVEAEPGQDFYGYLIVRDARYDDPR
jgi:hypothetical protein